MKNKLKVSKHFLLLLLSLYTSHFTLHTPALAFDLSAEFPARVKKITLKNGMRFLVVERPELPTVSCVLHIRTGALDDDGGKSGLAHMFEHMLFKGTKTIGVLDHEKEIPLLKAMDRAYAQAQREEDKGLAADPKRLEALRQQIDSLEARHQKLIREEEFWKIYERAGAQGLNAATGYDYTNYRIEFPKNQLELWGAMEADRIKNPVLREFYKERAVVLEERRLRVDTSPQGRLMEAFLATAFMAHPYGRPVVGWEDEISRVTRADAETFFKQHYDVSRLVVALVGGVSAAQVERLAKKYFESIPSSNAALKESHLTREPEQKGERTLQVEYDAEPAFFAGYHRPARGHADAAALSVLSDILSSGKTSRFYRTLIEKKKIAVDAWSSATFPGERDPNLFVLGGTPIAPNTCRDVLAAMEKEIALLQEKGPTPEELTRVINQLETNLIRHFSTNEGLASLLSYYEAMAGDWKELLTELEALRAVSAADVQRVAKTYLKNANRTVAELVKPSKETRGTN